MKALTLHGLIILYCSAVGIAFLFVDVPISIKAIIDVLTVRYITFVNMILQVAFSIYCMFYDLSIIKYNDKVKKVQEFLFYGLVGPNNLFVSIAFWGIHMYDREGVLPVPLDVFLPNWLNHMVHTVIIVITVLELITCNREHPPFKLAYITYNIAVLSYGMLILQTYFTKGIWIYSIYGQLSTFGKSVLMILFHIAGHISFLTVWYFGKNWKNLLTILSNRGQTKKLK